MARGLTTNITPPKTLYVYIVMMGDNTPVMVGPYKRRQSPASLNREILEVIEYEPKR